MKKNRWASTLLNVFSVSTLSLHSLTGAAEAISELSSLNGSAWSIPFGMSADGSVIVGVSADRAFRWTNSGGMVGLGELNGDGLSRAYGISADGRTIVGETFANGSPNTIAYRWNAQSGMLALGPLDGNYSRAHAVSANGDVIVGAFNDGILAATLQAFRWTADTGMVSLGNLNGGNFSSATAVSADGSVIAGLTTDPLAGNQYRAFRWTSGEGMISLGTLNGDTTSEAAGISADGKVIVGSSGRAGVPDFEYRVFRWTPIEGMVTVGSLNGSTYAFARGVSADGKVIVGTAKDGNNGNVYRGFRWSAASGMQTIEQWALGSGVSVGAGQATKSAFATNQDGSIVTGQLENNHAYIARVSPLGSGVMDMLEFSRTLQAAARPHTLNNTKTGVVLHGLNGSPVRNLLKAGQQSTWGGADIGRQDHLDNRGNVDIGEIGYGYGLTDNLMIKTAVGKTWSDNHFLYNGNTTLRGAYVMPEIIYAIPDTPWHALISAYYNVGTVYTRRGYLNAGSQDYSHAKASTTTSALRVRLDWINAFRLASISFSPYISLTRAHSKVGAISETGGGFPVYWHHRSETDTQYRLGADSTYHLGYGMNLIGRFETVHRFEAYGSSVTGDILGLSSFHFAGEANKRDWLRLGFGIEGKAGPGMFSVMANVTTEAQTASSWIYAHYRVNF